MNNDTNQPSLHFSIDKLCILGKFKNISNYDKILEYFYYNPRFEVKYITNQFFANSFLVDDIGFIQIDRVSNKFRFEFNPNHIKTKEDSDLINIILSHFKEFHFSRLDIALDLYNYNFINYNIVDLAPRKKAYYYDRVGNLETCYFGAMGSNKFVRIYNKAREQKIPNMDWWRVELQLRDLNIDIYLEDTTDFLKDIYFFKYITIESLGIEERSILEYVLKDISRLNELSKNAKTKYKKIISNLEIESLDFINPIIRHSANKVVEYLMNLCPGLYRTYDKSDVFKTDIEKKCKELFVYE